MPSAKVNCFVDTNILLYARDLVRTAKTIQAEGWLRQLVAIDALVISPQVMSEFAHVVLRKFPHVATQELSEALTLMRPWCKAETSPATVELALRLFQEMRTSWFDGMLLASAMQANCSIFLSEDQQHGRVIDGLTILNPFQAEPAQVLDQKV